MAETDLGQMSGPLTGNKRTAYFFQPEICNYYFGAGHPMKPIRLKLTHSLLVGYGLLPTLDVYRSHLASHEELAAFHTDDYTSFLNRINPTNAEELAEQCSTFQVGNFTDCPAFEGVWGYCQMLAGGSIDGAVRLNAGDADVAINWSGGMHHAKKNEASGFCYVNDIVLGILELLKVHQRVLYIDIDIHHGDGVEEAFYTTDRVMTCSFHKYGNFFPGTGDVKEQGHGPGKGYSVNFPLQEGITDEAYHSVYKPVIARIMETYRPGAVVMCCGADSLAGDRLGCFNLTLDGHAECIKYAKSFGLPTLVLGGGGYTPRNVARCWAHETGVLLGQTMDDLLPESPLREYFRPSYKLRLGVLDDLDNQNSHDYLHKNLEEVMEQLRQLPGAPSVPFQNVPPALLPGRASAGGTGAAGSAAETVDPDTRDLAAEVDAKAHAGEHYDVSAAAAATALADSGSVVKLWDGSQEAGGEDVEQLQVQAASGAGDA